ncbi:hypothetical protein B5M47_02515 [candidate division CPR3 bacterium 4484_211]|uniref:UPF0251 protein B5M47_02515 n=1 Tax=candidate division CPR3 bacterium 4484_211 TaxID=1968527 RepID=A0A1W9NXT3_UNCC3|nr:MAG: hypothetical protein B5M47_02515 [candidate division CPR3 bacterium 4484_211]
MRPRKPRTIQQVPGVTYFKPRGILLSSLDKVVLTLDELEAVRLCDLEEQSQAEAAEKMSISQSTLQRILTGARQKIAEALVKGKAIQMKGGDYQMVTGRGLGRGLRRGAAGGRGRMGGPKAAGPGGFCVCPSCGHKEAHVAGQPCYQKSCPSCGARMVRE